MKRTALLTDILSQLAERQSITYDRSVVRQAIAEVTHTWPGTIEKCWWKWLLEGGRSLNLRMKVLDEELAGCLPWARQNAILITLIPVEQDEYAWLRVSGDGRYFQVASNHAKLAARGLSQQACEAWLSKCGVAAAHRWVVVGIVPGWECPTVAPVHGGQESSDGADLPATPTPLQRLYAVLRPEWADIGVIVVFAMFVGVLALATPIAVEALVNTVAFGRFLQPVLILSLILFVFLMFAACLHGIQTYAVEVLQRRLFARAAADLGYRLPRLQQEALDGRYGPELVNRFFDVVTLQKVCSQFLLDALAVVIATFVGMAVLAFYHPWLLGFDAVLLALMLFTIFVLGRGAVSSSVEESKKKYGLVSWLEDVARCRSAFRLRDADEFALDRVDYLTTEYLNTRAKHFRVLLRQILFALFLQALASTALLGLGGWLVIQGQLTLGQLVAAELIVAMIVGAFAKFGKHIESFYDLLAGIDKLGTLFDLPVERPFGLIHVRDDQASAIALRGVTYHYPSGETALSGLTLDVASGDVAGITGPPGSGKSTLAQILFGLRTPGHGFVELDGVDLRDIRLDVLRRRVAMVDRIEVFPGTLEENVVLHRPEITRVQLREALSRAELLREIVAMPGGLDTPLSATGAPLSQSQLIRLMIARAIVAEPRLLVIDGLLDALDDSLQRQVLSNLRDHRDQWTLLVLSGQDDVLSQCDYLVDIHDGMQAATNRAAILGS